MRVFLTGASGYIGRHIGQALIRSGHQVVGLARSDSKSTRLQQEINWIYSDLIHFKQHKEAFNQVDAVIHCAMNYDDNGIENRLLEAQFTQYLNKLGCYFIGCGNLYAEADSETQFIPETRIEQAKNWRSLNENRLLSSNFNGAIIRLGFVYGGNGGYLWKMLPPESVASINDAALNRIKWPMVNVKDVAELFIKVLESNSTGIFHAYDGVATSAAQVVQTLRTIYQLEHHAGALPHQHVEGLFAKSLTTSNQRSLALGWSPEFGNFASVADKAYEEYLRWESNL